MENSIQDRVREAEAKLRSLLTRARDALAGREDFTVKDIRSISERLGHMEPIVAQSRDLRAKDVHLDADFKAYAKTLKQLETTLEQVRFMYLARLAHLDAARNHRETVNLWVTAFKQTQ
ncbi:MAG: hypothetical protein ABSA96_06620 [Candidatus Acidiferrales bacterium]